MDEQKKLVKLAAQNVQLAVSALRAAHDRLQSEPGYDYDHLQDPLVDLEIQLTTVMTAAGVVTG